MSKKVNIDKLSMEIADIFNSYKDLTFQQVGDAVKSTARRLAKNINSRASALFSGKKYRKSWKYKRDPELRGRWRHSMVVYSTEYRVAHLLEKGHAKRNGGRVAGREHIEPSVEEARDILIDEILNELE